MTIGFILPGVKINKCK